MTAAQLLEALRKADLSHFYLNFTMHGVNTIDALLVLSSSQYSALGINAEDEQNRLIELCEYLRRGSLVEISSKAINQVKQSTGNLRPVSSNVGGGVRNSSGGLNAYGVPANANSRTNRSLGGSAENNSGPVDRIRVCVRKRPLSEKELARNERDIAKILSNRSVAIKEPK